MWRRFKAWIGQGDPWIELGAGLTVSLVSLPQCLAYAMMSGLPPEYGLVTAAIPGLVAALSLLPILFFGGQAVGYIPQAALAGVLWVTAWSMIKRERMARIWRASLASRHLLIATFLATLILPLEWAIFLGVGLGLLLHLGQNARARVRFWRVGPGLKVEALERLDGLDAQDTLIVEVSGSFHYAAVQQFREELAQELPAQPARVIFDLSHAHHMRFAAVLALEQLHEQLQARGQQLILCGVSEPFGQILSQTDAKVRWFAQSPVPSACALALSQPQPQDEALTMSAGVSLMACLTAQARL